MFVLMIAPSFCTDRLNVEENALVPGSETAFILHGAGRLLPRLLQYNPT